MHYIPVNKDLSNAKYIQRKVLPDNILGIVKINREMLQFARENDQLAQEIAER